MMIERLDPTLTPSERRSVWERIRMEVTSGWQTEAHPRERLTVADEREHALFYLAEVVYRVVPALYEEIALWMQTVFGLPPELGRMPLVLRFGSWVGGDMDGNTEVHAKTIRETLLRQQQRVISAYFQECRALADKLSQSAGRVGASRELEARIAEYDILLPKAREAASTRHDRMPYRIFLAQVAERLRTTYEGRPNHYESAEQFMRDIQLIAASLRANHGRHAGLFPVERLLCRALTFGFHLATLDVRQHAAVHRDVVAQGLGRDGLVEPRSPRRAAARCASPSTRDRGPAAGFDAVGRRTLAVFEAMMQARNKYGERAIGDYIVSGTECAGRRAVGAAARALGQHHRPREREVPLDVVPMLEIGGRAGRRGRRARRRCSRSRATGGTSARASGRQTVLLGFSESNKSIGLAASRHAIYQAQADLMAPPRRRASTSRCSTAAAARRAAAAGRSTGWSRARRPARRAGGCARPSRARASATATGCGALRCAPSRRPCSRWCIDRFEIAARRRASGSCRR